MTQHATALYGLLGRKLGHSFSAAYFSEKFERLGLKNQYLNFEFQTIEEAISSLRSMPLLKGFNVTIPYKETIIPYLDSITAEAAAIGAVNVVSVVDGIEGRRLIGTNSDATGFANSVRRFVEDVRPSVNALILGTGGASKAVDFALQRMGMNVTFVSRTPNDERTIGYSTLSPRVMSENLLIVNTTPLGMYPETEGYAPIPYELLTPAHRLFDLVYNPAETRFMSFGNEQGAKTKNGLEMLYLQAEEAWNVWNGAY